MRDQVCGKRIQQEDDNADATVLANADTSALVPRFVLMAPVQVFTGRADPDPDAPAAKALPAGKVPLPHLRPRNPGDTAARGVTKSSLDAIAIQISAPN
jgi:hypothetical protein